MPKAKNAVVPSHFKYYFPGMSGMALFRVKKHINAECEAFM
jgi:hypothetical protein